MVLESIYVLLNLHRGFIFEVETFIFYLAKLVCSTINREQNMLVPRRAIGKVKILRYQYSNFHSTYRYIVAELVDQLKLYSLMPF